MMLQTVRLVAIVAILTGCRHSEPINFDHGGEPGPFDPTPPVRLTRDLGPDQFAAWTADGREIAYSHMPGISGSRNHCVAFLPSGGGQVGRTTCYRLDVSGDSTHARWRVAPRTRHDFAWVDHHSFGQRLLPDNGGLMVGDPADPARTVRLTRFPYVGPDGTIQATVTSLHWLSAERLIYVGSDLTVRRECTGCVMDTIPLPRQVMLINRDGTGRQAIPNSAEVTGLALNEDSTAIYFTRAGDPRVWRRTLPDGEDEAVISFDGTIARDVSVAGGRLAVVVDGVVSYGFDETVGPYQLDRGGNLRTVNLETGSIEGHNLPNVLFRRPALAPDGRSMVAEGVPLDASSPDLWRFQVN